MTMSSLEITSEARGVAWLRHPLLLATICLIAGSCVGAHGLKNGTLYSAAQKGDLANAKRLLDEGADPNTIGDDGDIGLTPLMIAASQGHLDMVKLLIAKGADPTLKGSGMKGWKHGSTPEIQKIIRDAAIAYDAKRGRVYNPWSP